MNVYDVEGRAGQAGGEYVLGAAELSTHACYLIYGLLTPGESGRVVKPGRGHEEIFCLVRGEAVIRYGDRTFRMRGGEAFHLKGEETCLIENADLEAAVYVVAGGHAEGQAHS